MEDFIAPQDELRLKIAMAAARLIAEDGYDYPAARSKALRTIAGKTRLARECIPGDQEIQEQLRAWQGLFQADTQPLQLQQLRQAGLAFMLQMPEFEPVIYGAAVNGTGSEHSDLHILAFADDTKEIDYWLLNRNMAFDACEDALLGGQSFPANALKWQSRWLQLGVAEPRSRRGLLNRHNQGSTLFQTDTQGLARLIEQQPAQEP